MTTPNDNTFRTVVGAFVKAKAYKSHVYLLKVETPCDGIYYKIGIATNVRHRINTLQTGNQYKIQLVATCAAPRYAVEDIEKTLHGILTWFNARGEWFKLPDHALEKVLKVFAERTQTE
jgi:hypothetical protein